MKRILTVSLAALLLILSVQPVAAASGFSLYQGEISGNYLGNALLGEIFKNMRIDAVFSEENQTYRLSGTAEAKSAEYEIPYGKDGPFVGSSTGTGKLWGTYDPLTGGFGGFIQFDEVFNGTRKDETLTSNVFTMGAHFTGLANYGDINVDLAFAGGVGTDGTNQSVSFSVTFAVQGTLPFTQEPTDEPEETEESEETTQAIPAMAELPDSGARFSDLNGQVEVLIPKGYDNDGKPIYDEEAWTFAKLDMPLPEGTRIKTQDRSSVILSFGDMTTFVMKPESEIALLKQQSSGPIKLLVGDLWGQFNKLVEGKELFEGSQAVAGIKGTTFVLKDDGETTNLKVIEGTVEFTSKATSKSVIVTDGETVSATKDGLGNVKTFDVNVEMANWEDYGATIPSECFPSWVIVAVGLGTLALVLIVIITTASRRKKRSDTATHTT